MNDPTPVTFGGAQTEDLLLDSTPASEQSVLDSLTEALAAAVEIEPLTLTVPGRPNMSLRFRPSIEFELFQEWVKKASKPVAGKRGDGSPDYLRLGLTVISHTNTEILMKGQVAYDRDGTTPLSVRSARIHDMLKVPSGSVGMAIRKIYGSDGHVVQTMQRIIKAAGYSLEGDVDEEGDGPLDLL